MKSIIFKYLLFLILSILIGRSASASDFSPELRTYRITCDPVQFATLITYLWRNDPIPCVFADDSGATLNAELRLRGESGREYPKKSFKVNFPALGRYGTRDKINLNSEWTDASFVREFLSYDMFSRAGLLSPKCKFVKLFVNEQYYGLYLDVEQVDKRFLSDRGLDDDAPLYKAAENGTMLHPGEIEAGLWERVTGDETDFSELKKLIGWLANVPDGSFYEGLNIRFDRAKLSRAIAVNSLIGNTSTYYHNYYLVRFRGEAGRWEYIPWDVDQTFYYRYNFTLPPYYRSGHQTIGTNELIRRCWLDDQMRAEIRAQVSRLVDSVFTYDYIYLLTDSLNWLLQDAIEQDTVKQYSYNDFVMSLELIPESVAGRSAQVVTMIRQDLHPFDVIPAVITPQGVSLQWTPASDNDEFIKYYIEVGTDIEFFEPEWPVYNLTQTNYLLQGLPQGEFYWRVTACCENGNQIESINQFSKFEVHQFDFNAIDTPYLITGRQRIRPGQGIYRASRDIVIEPDGVLEIERGVRILFADSARLIVKGRLEIVDTAGDSVGFEPLDPTIGWGGIRIESGGSASLMSAAISGIEQDSGSAAIYLEEAAELTLSHSTVTAGGDYTIFATDASLKMDYCRIITEGWFVRIDRGNFTLISDCDFVGGRDSSVFQLKVNGHTGTFRIERSQFSMGNRGIEMENVEDAYISRCWFEELAAPAMGIWNSQAHISNSIFVRCAAGVILENSSVEIWNSNFVKCDDGISRGADIPARIRNSVFYATSNSPVDNLGGAADISYCLSDKPLPGIGNILGAPQFEKPWDGDFTPESGSPLIDAGLSDGAPETDYYGRPRLNTDGQKNWGEGRYKYYDIGAIEYPVGIATPAAMGKEKVFIYPNPANDRAEVIFEIEINGRASLALFDINGRQVGGRTFDHITAGQYRVGIDSFHGNIDLSTGLYFCRLDQASGSFITKMVVVR